MEQKNNNLLAGSGTVFGVTNTKWCNEVLISLEGNKLNLNPGERLDVIIKKHQESEDEV